MEHSLGLSSKEFNNMNEKIRVVVDYTTPTRERRPTTIEDIYDDFKVLEFNSKEELANELAQMNGYEDVEEFKQELADAGDSLDDYDFEGDELDKICQYFLSSLNDPGDGSPNIQYISINGKPAYKDYWMTYDTLSDNMELLAHGSEEDIIKYYLEHDYDYVEDEDEEYEPQLTTDRMHAGQRYESLHENKKMRTEQDWEDELENDNSEIFHVMNSLQSVLDTVDYLEPEMIYSYMDEIHDLFIQGEDKELDHVIRKA